MTIASAFVSGNSLPGISPGVFGPDDFRAIAAIVHDEAGIVLPAGKAMLVYSRIAPLVRESGCGTFAPYIQLVRQSSLLRKRTIDALTTNHTFFYREGHHFLHFAEEVRPELLAALERAEPVRLWSAGCSSGEETWSLVATLLGEDKPEGRRIAGRNVRVLASDIADHALKKAIAARYDAQDAKSVPFALRCNWMPEADGTVSMAAEARAIVRFRELNLQGEWPMKRFFDVIFCRNVMIYFDKPTKERLVERMTRRLRPGGYLYIGHSERVTGPATELLDAVGPTIYRRRIG